MAGINEKLSTMLFPMPFERQFAGSLDAKELWFDLEALKEYAKSETSGSYTGQTVKFIDKENSNKVTIYTIAHDGSLITSGVNDADIDRWNDTYTKAETDANIKTAKDEVIKKIDDLEKARVWKDSVDTFDDIATTYPEPQDTWTVVVRDTNTTWQYNAEEQKWVDLGHSVIHENATQEKDGLMSKEDKAKLDGINDVIETAKTELTKKITEIDTAYKAADTKLTENLTTAKTELEEKIANIDAKFIAATDEQIISLFEATVTIGDVKKKVAVGEMYSPEMPEIDGYTYEGLYKDAECSVEQEVPFEVTEDVNINIVKK